MTDSAPTPKVFREKTLHELNLEQREINRNLYEQADAAAMASADAVRSVLGAHNPNGKRIQKNFRAPPAA